MDHTLHGWQKTLSLDVTARKRLWVDTRTNQELNAEIIRDHGAWKWILFTVYAITCCCSSILLFARRVKATTARNSFIYQNCLLWLNCAIPLDITRGCKTSSSIISQWTSLLETQQTNQIRAALLSGGMSNSIMCSSAACRVHAMCSGPTSSGFFFILFFFFCSNICFSVTDKTVWLIVIENHPFQMLREQKQQ